MGGKVPGLRRGDFGREVGVSCAESPGKEGVVGGGGGEGGAEDADGFLSGMAVRRSHVDKGVGEGSDEGIGGEEGQRIQTGGGSWSGSHSGGRKGERLVGGEARAVVVEEVAKENIGGRAIGEEGADLGEDAVGGDEVEGEELGKNPVIEGKERRDGSEGDEGGKDGGGAKVEGEVVEKLSSSDDGEWVGREWRRRGGCGREPKGGGDRSWLGSWGPVGKSGRRHEGGRGRGWLAGWG